LNRVRLLLWPSLGGNHSENVAPVSKWKMESGAKIPLDGVSGRVYA
jgi:hypothetical protein